MKRARKDSVKKVSKKARTVAAEDSPFPGLHLGGRWLPSIATARVLDCLNTPDLEAVSLTCRGTRAAVRDYVARLRKILSVDSPQDTLVQYAARLEELEAHRNAKAPLLVPAVIQKNRGTLRRFTGFSTDLQTLRALGQCPGLETLAFASFTSQVRPGARTESALAALAPALRNVTSLNLGPGTHSGQAPLELILSAKMPRLRELEAPSIPDASVFANPSFVATLEELHISLNYHAWNWEELSVFGAAVSSLTALHSLTLGDYITYSIPPYANVRSHCPDAPSWRLPSLRRFASAYPLAILPRLDAPLLETLSVRGPLAPLPEVMRGSPLLRSVYWDVGSRLVLAQTSLANIIVAVAAAGPCQWPHTLTTLTFRGYCSVPVAAALACSFPALTDILLDVSPPPALLRLFLERLPKLAHLYLRTASTPPRAQQAEESAYPLIANFVPASAPLTLPNLTTLDLCLASDAVFTGLSLPQLRMLELNSSGCSFQDFDSVLRAAPALQQLKVWSGVRIRMVASENEAAERKQGAPAVASRLHFLKLSWGARVDEGTLRALLHACGDSLEKLEVWSYKQLAPETVLQALLSPPAPKCTRLASLRLYREGVDEGRDAPIALPVAKHAGLLLAVVAAVPNLYNVTYRALPDGTPFPKGFVRNLHATLLQREQQDFTINCGEKRVSLGKNTSEEELIRLEKAMEE